MTAPGRSGEGPGGGLRLTRYDDAHAFTARAGAFLAEREAEHNLIFSIVARIGSGEPIPGAYLAAVEEDGAVVAVATRTPPYGLVLSETERTEAAVPLIAGDVAAAMGTLPSVLGPARVAAAFAEAWEGRTSQPASLSLRERVFRISRVIPPPATAGSARRAGAGDRDLLIGWVDAFIAEALPTGFPGEDTAVSVDRRMAEDPGGWFLWETGDGPVSVTGAGGATPNGVRIGPVYTPPELRGRGYATALVAEVTERMFAAGRRFCFLFTDLANPTSNAIYQRIGYEAVSDVDQYQFAAPTS